MPTNTDTNQSPIPEEIHPAQEVLNQLMHDSQRRFLARFADSAENVSKGIKACLHVIENNPHFPANANHSFPQKKPNPDIPDYAALQQFSVTAAKLLADNARQHIEAMKEPPRPIVKRKLADLKSAANSAAKTRSK